jgi:hypothetical protein
MGTLSSGNGWGMSGMGGKGGKVNAVADMANNNDSRLNVDFDFIDFVDPQPR